VDATNSGQAEFRLLCRRAPQARQVKRIFEQIDRAFDTLILGVKRSHRERAKGGSSVDRIHEDNLDEMLERDEDA
jgi:hypothetical protein